MNLAIKAETAADINGLPHGRITTTGGNAHVFTSSLDDLHLWYIALGGRITSKDPGTGVVLWTLHTLTERTHGTPIRVHALALDTDQLDADCAPALAHTTSL